MTPRLKEILHKEIQPVLKETLGLKNINMTPKIEKIVINMGLGLNFLVLNMIFKKKRQLIGKN